MLKKTERLSKKEFSQFYKVGKKYHFKHITIVFAECPTLHASVVVGKKVSKQAVRRNVIRRRIYAQLYSLLKKESIVGVFIVVVKPSYITLPRRTAASEIVQNIAAVLKKT